MATPLLTIQIVTWNSASHMPTTLAALKDLPAALAHVRVIDNHSSDNTVALVQSLLPTADVIELPHNIGFAVAHNLGFAKCSTEFVMTHDPDVSLLSDALPELLAAFEDGTVAAVQGKLYRRETAADGRGIIDSAGIVHTATLNGRERGAGEVDTGQYNAPEKLLAVTGAGGIFRMSALQAVAHHDSHGPQIFDEDFFAYKEDVDLGWRLNRAGFTCLYEPVVMGTHARTLGKRGSLPWFLDPAQAFKRLASIRTRYSIRNYVWMLIKNISWQEEIIYGIPIATRLLIMLAATIIFFPLLPVWFEVVEKLPDMVHKRHH
ncbi:MAG: glycosyltransferase [Candidatus Andersenbacteria bacterium]|nr:glycosyltransferase [Candidatus Andersenbacteria bacterium]